MGRFSFRAGINAENPDFTIVERGRENTVRRLVVNPDGSVTETVTVVDLGNTEEGDA